MYPNGTEEEAKLKSDCLKNTNLKVTAGEVDGFGHCCLNLNFNGVKRRRANKKERSKRSRTIAQCRTSNNCKLDGVELTSSQINKCALIGKNIVEELTTLLSSKDRDPFNWKRFNWMAYSKNSVEQTSTLTN